MQKQSTRYNTEVDEDGVLLPGLYSQDFSKGGKTRTEEQDQTDIRQIIARSQNGADFTHISTAIAKFGDFSNAPTYGEALQQIIDAEHLFASMNSSTRARFENDAEKFVAFVTNPTNADELVTLGLANKRESIPVPTPPTPAENPPETEETS